MLVIHGVVWPGLQNFQFVSSGNGYYLGRLGSDCPVSGVVSNLENCQAAAAELRRPYNFAHTNDQRPAGCYYWSTIDYRVYFNRLNPSNTQNIDYRTGGVCKGGMLYIVQYKVYKYIFMLAKIQSNVDYIVI